MKQDISHKPTRWVHFYIFECLIILCQLWLRQSVFGLHSALGIAQWETAHRERWALSNNKKEQFNAPADLIKWFFPLYQLPARKLLHWDIPGEHRPRPAATTTRKWKYFYIRFSFCDNIFMLSVLSETPIYLFKKDNSHEKSQCFYLNVSSLSVFYIYKSQAKGSACLKLHHSLVPKRTRIFIGKSCPENKSGHHKNKLLLWCSEADNSIIN